MSRLDFSSTSRMNMSSRTHFDLNMSMNQSLNQTTCLAESSKHKVKAYDRLLPVLVVEAISTETLNFRSLSVKIAESGWAWLVCGRRLFVWKYANDSKRGSACFELELPPTDLAHKAELVTLLPPATVAGGARQASELSTVSAVAVSPEGILRYWPNVAKESHSIETTVSDFHGEECYMLTNITATTCLLGTTTSTLVSININPADSNAPVHFHTLKAPQGVLAGFSKRVTSFIFGSLPAANGHEARSLVRIATIGASADQTDSSFQSVAVLAGTLLQRWLLFESSEQLMYEYDFDRALRSAFTEGMRMNNRTALATQLQIFCVDFNVRQINKFTLLVAFGNAESASQLHFAIAVFEDRTAMGDIHQITKQAPQTQANLSLISFNVLANHVIDARSTHDEFLGSSRLLIGGTQESSLIYVYDHRKVLCVQGGSEVIDVIDFSQRDDGILGAGFDSTGAVMLFTFRDALVSLVPTVRDNLSSLGFAVPRVQIQPSEDDTLARLKQAFYHYCAKKTQESFELLQRTFSDASGCVLLAELNASVAQFSAELLDALPSSDPRWAESEPRSLSGASTAGVIIGKQIEEKLASHLALIDFLRACPYWSALQMRAENSSPTQLILYEHWEKLTCAYSLKCKQAPLSYLLDPVIKHLAKKRGHAEHNLLTPADLFFREITKVHDVFAAVVDFQENELMSEARSQNMTESYNLVASCSSMMVAVFQELATLRRNIAGDYAIFANSLDDFVPWDASEPGGIRSALMKQILLLTERGFLRQLTPDEEVEFKSVVYQKVADLTDSLLGSYVHQLKLLQRDSNQRVEVEKKYHADRSRCLTLLLRARQFERATALAEKYLDFDVLIRVCEELDNKERLNSYCQAFAELNFAEYLYNWYLREGKQAKMLTTALPTDASLDGFLRNHDDLAWLHQVHSDRFADASRTLLTLSSAETERLPRKQTLLSLSKLAALAAGNTDVSHINSQLHSIASHVNLAS